MNYKTVFKNQISMYFFIQGIGDIKLTDLRKTDLPETLSHIFSSGVDY